MAERDSTTPVYGIAVAAELADMNAASLRLLEQKGLLTPGPQPRGARAGTATTMSPACSVSPACGTRA